MISADPMDVLAHKVAPLRRVAAPCRDLLHRVTGLNDGQAGVLVRAPRVQARLTEYLTRARNFPPASDDPEPAVLASAHVLDRSVQRAGAVLIGPALAQIVTREARAAVAAWLPSDVLRFALRQRMQDAPEWQPMDANAENVTLAGQAAALAWLDQLAPGDRLRLSLRWATPDPKGNVFLGADADRAARVFRAVVSVCQAEPEGPASTDPVLTEITEGVS